MFYAYEHEKVFPWISHTENAINFDKCTMNERTKMAKNFKA